jgi:hypothetical protein
VCERIGVYASTGPITSDDAANVGVAYAISDLAVIALDMTTGELQWWQPISYEKPSRQD